MPRRRREAVPVAVALVVVLAFIAFLDLDVDDNPADLVIALLPVLPAMALGFVYFRRLGAASAQERTTELEALAGGFAAAMLITLVGASLDAAGVDVSPKIVYAIFIGGIAGWMAVLALRSP